MTTNRDDGEPGRSRRRWLLGVAGLLAIPAAVVWWPGCRQYPPVSSRESLRLMKLLYSACNTKDDKRLAEVEKGLEKLTRDGKMAPAEREAFDKIVATAKAGKWEKAEEAAFRFAQDQVGVGHPDPDKDRHDHDHDKMGKASKGKGK